MLVRVCSFVYVALPTVELGNTVGSPAGRIGELAGVTAEHPRHSLPARR